MRMDEKTLRHVLAEVLQPIEQRLDRIETSLSEVRTQLNTLEHRVMDIGDSVRIAVRQTSAEMGELRHDLSRVKEKTGIR